MLADPFACSHHRAPDYFSESIRSYRGFWGWPCKSYINYLLGLCPHTDELVVAGEDCVSTTRGIFLITTNSAAPFAMGRWTDMPVDVTKVAQADISPSPISGADPLLRQLDTWGKLDGHFNNKAKKMMAFNAVADFRWDELVGNGVDDGPGATPDSTTVRYPLQKKSQFTTAFTNLDETNEIGNNQSISRESFLALYHKLFGNNVLE